MVLYHHGGVYMDLISNYLIRWILRWRTVLLLPAEADTYDAPNFLGQACSLQFRTMLFGCTSSPPHCSI